MCLLSLLMPCKGCATVLARVWPAAAAHCVYVHLEVARVRKSRATALAAERLDEHVHGADVLPALARARKDGAAGAALGGGQRRQPRAVLAHIILWCVAVSARRLAARALVADGRRGARATFLLRTEFAALFAQF